MKAPIAQPGALPGNAQDCAIGAFIGLHNQKRIQIQPGISVTGIDLCAVCSVWRVVCHSTKRLVGPSSTSNRATRPLFYLATQDAATEFFCAGQLHRTRDAGAFGCHSFVQVDRNFMLYLPRLTVLVTIEADRPEAWFPRPLSPYQAWFPGICLSQDFKRAKVPGNPMKSPFCSSVFWGVIFKKKIFASRQPNHANYLLSGL
jgi:hypothetical protein